MLNFAMPALLLLHDCMGLSYASKTNFPTYVVLTNPEAQASFFFFRTLLFAAACALAAVTAAAKALLTRSDSWRAVVSTRSCRDLPRGDELCGVVLFEAMGDVFGVKKGVVLTVGTGRGDGLFEVIGEAIGVWKGVCGVEVVAVTGVHGGVAGVHGVVAGVEAGVSQSELPLLSSASVMPAANRGIAGFRSRTHANRRMLAVCRHTHVAALLTSRRFSDSRSS